MTTSTRPVLRAIAGSAVLCALAACGGDDGPKGPAVVVSTTVLVDAQVAAGIAEADGVRGTRNASQSLSTFAGIGPITAAATPGVDLQRPLSGGTTTLSFDIDGDGAADALDVFVVGGVSYVGWSENTRCRLAYQVDGANWYIDGRCDGDTAVVCSYADGVACNYCDTTQCGACEVNAATADVRCFEFPPEAPVQDTGTTPDAGTDTGEADTGEDVSVDTETDTPVVNDTPCEDSCMANSGAVCCTTCGCAETDCVPSCESSGTNWDCEIGCCFDRETFACAE